MVIDLDGARRPATGNGSSDQVDQKSGLPSGRFLRWRRPVQFRSASHRLQRHDATLRMRFRLPYHRRQLDLRPTYVLLIKIYKTPALLFFYNSLFRFQNPANRKPNFSFDSFPRDQIGEPRTKFEWSERHVLTFPSPLFFVSPHSQLRASFYQFGSYLTVSHFFFLRPRQCALSRKRNAEKKIK